MRRSKRRKRGGEGTGGGRKLPGGVDKSAFVFHMIEGHHSSLK